MSAALETFCDRALSALCNGTYQGLILAAFVGMALAFCRDVNATTRHAVQFLTLILVAVLPIAHFLFGPPTPIRALARSTPPEPPGADPIMEAAVATPRIINDSAPGRLEVAAARPVIAVADDGAQPDARALPDPQPRLETSSATSGGMSWIHAPAGEPPFVAGRDFQPMLQVSSRPESAGDTAGADATVEAVTPASPSASDLVNLSGDWRVAEPWQPPLPAGTSLLLVGAWFLVAGARLAALGWQWAALRRLTRRGLEGPTPLRGLLESLCCSSSGANRAVNLRLSAEVHAPIVTGLWQPSIVLPLGMVTARATDLERVFVHELAHLRRKDDWTNLLQQVARALFFFHPAVLWLSRRLTVDREIACDDHVLSATRAPRSRRDYALFLTDFASRTKGRIWTVAPAAWNRRSQLKERIDMILDTQRNTSPRLARARLGILSTAAALVAGIGLYAGPRLAFTASAEEPAGADTAPTGLIAAGEDDRPPAPPLTSGEAKWKDQPAPPSAEAPPAPPAAEAPPAPLAAPSIDLAIRPHVVVSTGRMPRAAVSVLAAPTPTALAVAETPDGPVRVEGTPRPPSAGNRSSDLERRLSRLERQVRSLIRSNKAASNDELRDGKDNPDTELADKLEAKMGELKAKAKEKAEKAMKAFKDWNKPGQPFAQNWNFKYELNRSLDEARNEVEKATRDAARAMEDARRSVEEQREHGRNDALGESLDLQRRILGEQRRSLQKQLQNIEQQLGRLDQQIDRLEARHDKAEAERDRAESERDRVEREAGRSGDGRGKQRTAPEPRAKPEQAPKSEF